MVSGRPDGSPHGGAGNSTGTSDSVVAVAVSALHCGGGTDRQVTVTSAMHGCQSTTVTPARSTVRGAPPGVTVSSAPAAV